MLIIVTLTWVGQRPTVAKVSAIIIATWLVEFGGVALSASAVGMSPAEYYLQGLDSSLEQMGGTLGASQQALFSDISNMVAGCLPAILAVLSSAYVFAALCARWVFDRVRHKSAWTAFSMLDLSFWWAIPLIAGIVIYIVSLAPGIPGQNTVLLVALNVLVVSVIPLFVQGAACGKGVMNRVHMRLAWQLVLGFFGVITSIAFVVLPVIGLIDFWANFRKLPRDGQTPPQKRLPD